jgi:phenylpyruvate tautomerase PptA (4-oxalocrotonate tautomerase family)
MPTFTFSAAAGRLTPAQKADIARCCTTIYQEETGDARYLVEVIFYDVASGNLFVGGEPAGPDQIWIRSDMRAGRTEEQKGRILRRIVQGVAQSANAPEEAVWIYLGDIPSTSIAEYGHIMVRPGAVRYDDDPWFESLPAPLKASLRELDHRA